MESNKPKFQQTKFIAIDWATNANASSAKHLVANNERNCLKSAWRLR